MVGISNVKLYKQNIVWKGSQGLVGTLGRSTLVNMQNSIAFVCSKAQEWK